MSSIQLELTGANSHDPKVQTANPITHTKFILTENSMQQSHTCSNAYLMFALSTWPFTFPLTRLQWNSQNVAKCDDTTAISHIDCTNLGYKIFFFSSLLPYQRVIYQTYETKLTFILVFLRMESTLYFKSPGSHSVKRFST